MRAYKVTRARGKAVVIRADYVVIENGHAIFRTQQVRSYPVVVRVFAPKQWREIELGEAT